MKTSIIAIAVALGALSGPSAFAQEGGGGGFFKKKPAPVVQPAVAPVPVVAVPAALVVAPVATAPAKPPMPPMAPAAPMPTPMTVAAPMPTPFAAGAVGEKGVKEGKPAKVKTTKPRASEAAKRARQADIDGARVRAEAARAAKLSTPVATATVAPVAAVAVVPVAISAANPAQACGGMSSIVLDVCIAFQCATTTATKSHPTCLKLKEQNAARTTEQFSR